MNRRHFVATLVALIATASHRASSAQQTDPSVVLDGTLEILIEDQKEHSRALYFLVTEQQRVPLRFRGRPPQLTTGVRVRIRGVWQSDHVFLVSKIDRL